MSYQTWHDYGYGICVDDIETTVDKVLELVAIAPKFKKNFYDWVKDYMEDEDIEELTMDDIDSYEDSPYCDSGLAPIIASVIQECENVELFCCSDYNCYHYLIFSTTYPWCLNDKVKNMTEKDMCHLFTKYINILTDIPIVIDYQSVENGG